MKNNVKVQDENQSRQSCVSVSVTDLRIGNYYSYDNDSIKLDGSLLAAYLQNDTDLYLYPISLTEEWLLNAGFKQNPDKWFEINYFTDCKESAEKMGILINLCSNRCAILDTDTDEQSAMTAKRIYYVHQLQNLYFALTGSEL